MRLRLVTGLAAAAVVVGGVWVGAPWLTLLALLGGGLAIREAYRLTPPGVGPMPTVLGIIAVVALLLAAEAAAGPHFLAATGLALAAWAFAAILCVHGGATALLHDATEGLIGDDSRERRVLSTPRFRHRHWRVSERRYGYCRALEDSSSAGGLPASTRTPKAETGTMIAWEYFEETAQDCSSTGVHPLLGFLFRLLGPIYVGFLLGHGLALRDLGGRRREPGPQRGCSSLMAGSPRPPIPAPTPSGRLIGSVTGWRRASAPARRGKGVAGGFAASVGAMLAGGRWCSGLAA